MVRVDMKRSLLNKDLQKQCEFIIEYKVKAFFVSLLPNFHQQY